MDEQLSSLAAKYRSAEKEWLALEEKRDEFRKKTDNAERKLNALRAELLEHFWKWAMESKKAKRKTK